MKLVGTDITNCARNIIIVTTTIPSVSATFVFVL